MREVMMLLLLLLSTLAASHGTPESKCDLTKVAIDGGNFTVNAETGNVQYICPEGKYPYPAAIRECNSRGHWSNLRQKAQCKDFECPKIADFSHGEYYPRQNRYYVGDVLHFECQGGFHMRGPESRTCLINGKWSGRTTICDDKEGYCPDPGVPIGATKVGSFNNIESKVFYECQYGLKMFGSKQRTCKEDKTWSGTEPSCRSWYAYDTAEEVSQAFSSSLSETIEASNPNRVEDKKDRKVQIKKGGLLNFFLVIDASKSVGEDNFKIAKDISKVFIDKISSYDAEPRFSVLTYASYIKTIVTLSDDKNGDAEYVIDKINAFKYREHDDKQGTNTRGGLEEVLNQMSLDFERNKKTFFNSSNVIMLMTDGKHNMGGDPTMTVNRIKYFLNISKDREDKLDIYVFGLGSDTSLDELNDIASKKDKETHVFQMQNIQDMQRAFNDIIDETEAFQMCGLSREPIEGEDDSDLTIKKQQFPWIVKITITRGRGEENCKGSIISKNFILTAAHCFHLDDDLHHITVHLVNEHKVITRKVKDIHRHPSYDPNKKQDKNIPRSFDFDLALLELSTKLEFSSTIRPICLPCTTGTSWALKLRGQVVSCDDHKNLLLNGDLVKSMFVTEEEKKDNYVRIDVNIKQGNKRMGCLDDAKKVPEFKDVQDIRDVVTDNFLCTGGTEPQLEDQTCKGDSGGPLIIQYKKRFIQVGVISWGTVNSCEGYFRKQVPNESRDFHADVIKGNNWIKDVVEEDLIYID